jgi:hypothetical protein
MLGSWVPVLSSGKYPESIYELSIDANRTNFACYAWALGMSDKYPSFQINWNHKNIKIFLIILAIFPTFGGYVSGSHEQKRQLEQYENIDYSSLRERPSDYR